MAVSFTPKHKTEFPLSDLTPQQFIALAVLAAESLGWNAFDFSSIGFKLIVGKEIFSANELIKVKVIADTVSVESVTLGSEMIDFGKNKKIVNKLIAAIHDLQPNITTEEMEQKYSVLELIPDEFDDLQKPPVTASENFKSFLSIFVPQTGYFITPILINLNLLVFIVMAISGVNIFSPDNESLIRWGANFTPLTLDGQAWRLITNCFLHIGIFHLLMNMYALMYIGVLLEPYLCRTRFLSAYLLTGIAASTTSLWWHDITISAGASGAIFGMYGVFLALLTTDLIDKDVRKNLLTSITVFVGYNLLYGLKSGVDNAAHIGGLLSGIVIGYALIPSLKRPDAVAFKQVTVALIALLVFGASFFVYSKIPNNIAEYERRIQPFRTNESMAMEIYNLPDNMSKSKKLYEIKDRGIYYWNQNIALLNDLDKLELPEILHKKNALLKQYCEFRIKSYEFIYNAVDEDNKDKYRSQIDAQIQQIEYVLKKLENDN